MQFELNDNFKGKCLVAMPSIGDELFRNSVIYVTEHSTIGGAVGIILNKILSPEIGINKLFDNFKYDIPTADKFQQSYLGGPVEPTSSFTLYSDNNQLFLTGSKRAMEKISHNDSAKPMMVAVGYCMWETLQLEREVRFNHWLVVDNIVEYLLHRVNVEHRYSEALRIAGVNNIASFDYTGGGNA